MVALCIALALAILDALAQMVGITSALDRIADAHASVEDEP